MVLMDCELLKVRYVDLHQTTHGCFKTHLQSIPLVSDCPPSKLYIEKGKVKSVSRHRDATGKALPENHRHLVFPNGTLVIRNIHKSDNAGYVCVASNPDGQTSRSKLNVQVMEAPAIDPIPTKSDLQEGMRIHLNCVVTKGDFPITFRWLKDGSEIPSALAVTEKSLDDYSRALTFNSLSVLHSGNYTCQASNAVATTNHTTLLVVNVPPSWKVEPKDSESLMGQNLLVSCAAEGSPKPTIRWTRESGMPPSTYEDLSHTMNNYRILENGSLWIQNIHPENKGYYSCQATNGIGMGLNKIIYVTVHVPATFSSPVQNVTVVKAGVATLDCVAKGDKPISINWFLQGQPFDPAQHPRAEVSEESLEFGVHSRLLIKNVNRDDSSSFICQATNHFGSDRSDFHLIVQETPGPPTNMHVTGHTSRSVNLTWDHSYDGNSPVSVYIIQYKSTMASSWQKNVQQIIVDGEQTSASINDLLPAHTYHIRVLARNSLGVSNGSSIITITTTEEVPGGPPRDIQVQARNSETLLVTWKPPEEHLHHGEIMGYYIGYRAANSSEPFHYKTYEVIPGMELRNILSGLRKFTEYSVLVQAYNRAGAGPRSEEVLAMTDEDVPGSPPSEVHCTALSSQSILVVWSSPPISDINGVLLGYRVTYRTVMEWDDVSTPSEQTTQVQKLEIFGLQRYCNYSIEVKAYTRKGDGVPSKPIFCRTQEDVPGAPDDIKALVMDSRTLLISWRPPRFPNGVIINYKVYIQSLDGASLPMEQFEVPPSQTHYTLSHLSPQRRYEMKVSAATAAGEGVPSTSVVQAPSTHTPARIASFGHKMKVARGEELQLPCIAVGQPPPRREWFHGGKSIQEDDHLRINSEWTLLIPAVKLSDTGNYTCSAENVFGKDEITYFLLVQESRNKGIPLAPTDFEVSKSTVSSISLSWKSSLSTTNTVQGYYLNYKREFGEWEKIKLSAEENDFTLDGLQCGTKYQFYLQAFNQLGQSTPSETITSHTRGTAPIAPSKSHLIRVNSTSISLNVGSWGTGGCPITTLVVEYKPRQQHEWTLVSNNLKYQQIDFPVLDLSPETWYTLRMTAHNSAGSTVSSYDFITLTNSGAIVEPDLIIHSGYKYNHFYNDLGVIIPVITSLVTVIVAGIGIFLYFRRKQESLPDNKFVGTTSEKSCDMAPTGGTSACTDQKVSGCTMMPSSPRTASGDREEPLYLPEPVPPATPASTDTVNPYATFRLPPDAENLPAYDNYSDSVYMKIKKKSQQINADGDWVPLHSLYQAHRY
ncbi:Down syndrome cell adhesion molecule-like protein Dscam2 [Schistocerca nitens]|uniref:Down syndrome cell adhesion molecule-like protein Dscam2 n=1 Tax=Schistocerca nitens TaxID=7011 RepID=UPI0021192659|nr:Down syndrome cell adhesion molecule-like protein Dscam2 [Schistocerca nitens]